MTHCYAKDSIPRCSAATEDLIVAGGDKKKNRNAGEKAPEHH